MSVQREKIKGEKIHALRKSITMGMKKRDWLNPKYPNSPPTTAAKLMAAIMTTAFVIFRSCVTLLIDVIMAEMGAHTMNGITNPA